MKWVRLCKQCWLSLLPPSVSDLVQQSLPTLTILPYNDYETSDSTRNDARAGWTRAVPTNASIIDVVSLYKC